MHGGPKTPFFYLLFYLLFLLLYFYLFLSKEVALLQGLFCPPGHI